MAENGTKVFTVDKFLGLNESADGETELKMGEASRIENFYITDNFNLRSRDGVKAVRRVAEGKLEGITAGNIDGKPWLLATVIRGNALEVTVQYMKESDRQSEQTETITGVSPDHPVKIFTIGEKVYICARKQNAAEPALMTFTVENEEPVLSNNAKLYAPLVITGASPAGGGTDLEKANLLTAAFETQYSADGTATAFVLPSYTAGVSKILVDNKEATGSYDKNTHTLTFSSPPAKGVNNVQISCAMEVDSDIIAAREKFFAMRYSEAYNGATDTRTFFYGDGSNVCFYTGMCAYADGLYLPAGNEIAVDTSASPITAMARNYSSLIGFQTDGAFVITYEPITLADGSVTAGFYMRTASREFGNDMNGQVQTVNNYLRTLSGGSLYEWRYTSTQYRDERYAKRISEKISKTLETAEPEKIVTCDDNADQTYYMFLNDEKGTVLVNRYSLDVWTMYRSDVFRDVKYAVAYGGRMLFANEKTIFTFGENTSYDEGDHEEEVSAVNAVWESGFLSFGADYKRKYSSRLWISLLPESASDLEVTVQTDKRSDYIQKNIGYFLTDFTRVDFSNFSFKTWWAPMIKRVQIKVKKFVYYKLIFRVTKPGARATVLGYDQQIRYSSNVK